MPTHIPQSGDYYVYTLPLSFGCDGCDIQCSSEGAQSMISHVLLCWIGREYLIDS